MRRITIVVVDDHKIVRQGLKILLQNEGDFQIVGEADNGYDALQLIYQRHPDVLLTDLSMNGLTGIELCRQARESSPRTECIILSMHAETSYVEEALRSGAKGYVLKENGVGDLIHAIRDVMAGRIFVSPYLTAIECRNSFSVIPRGGNGTSEGGNNSMIDSLKKRIEELREIAFVDQLTGIGNRRYAEISLRTKTDEFNRYGWVFGVILGDIDNFKRVNDTYGHATGDRVLQMVAAVISQNIRNSDSLFYRWGGEEFLLIASNVNERQLFEISERVRMLVASSALSAGGETIKVTISAGMALVRVDDSPLDLVSRADKALYVSKKEGKNRGTMSREEALL
jgi:diguanylate cyclase (GGDEF)-like protein